MLVINKEVMQTIMWLTGAGIFIGFGAFISNRFCCKMEYLHRKNLKKKRVNANRQKQIKKEQERKENFMKVLKEIA